MEESDRQRKALASATRTLLASKTPRRGRWAWKSLAALGAAVLFVVAVIVRACS